MIMTRINNIRKYVILFLLVLGVSLFGKTASVRAEDTAAKGQIVMSVEKATIGQGYIMEPQYVDFYEGDTLATITLRQLTRIGRHYNYDGRIQSGFYLSEISDPGRDPIQVPEYIQNDMRKMGITLYQTDFTPEYLGEKDYSRQSGWIYDYNGVQPNVSSCDITPRNGDVLQWKFTMVALGHDVDGDTEYFDQNHLVRPDRVRLNKLLAEVRKNADLLNNDTVRMAYNRCLALSMNLRTSKSDLTLDMNTLRKALNWNTISSVKLWGDQAKECSVKNGTEMESISDFPSVLSATKSDGSTISVNVVSWYCAGKYTPSKAGDYVFYPELPDAYIVGEGVALPSFTVHVRKFGDTNTDGQVTEQDIDKLLGNDYFGQAFQPDEDGAVCDLNSDGIVNMQDYSLLVGALSGSDIRSEDDGRLVLRYAASDCAAGEETTADLILYSGMIDTVGIQLNTEGVLPGISMKCAQNFKIEYTETNENGVFVMLGRRSGALRAQSINGVCIGTLTFKCKSEGKPELKFGKGSSSLLANQSVLGYRNGYQVSFQTDNNYGKDTRFFFQLNEGRVRRGQTDEEEITENGIAMKLVRVSFSASDAENTAENRIRMRAQLPDGANMVIGGSVENGSITDELTLHEDGIFYAEGETGCFKLGQAAQKETCVLYGLITDASGHKSYYKFQIERKGYRKTTWTYTASQPLVLDGWSLNDPEVLSGKWNLDDLKLQGWDGNGDPVDSLYVAMPSDDTTQQMYYKKESDTTGTLYVKEAGDYWLEIRDSEGEVRGKIRIIALYPYAAADYFINQAKEISLDAADYNASVSDQLFTYKDLIDKVERVQKKYTGNMPLYLDGMGRYVLEVTENRATDAWGYEMNGDSLRTDVVNNLRQGMATIRPVLEENKKLPEPVQPEEPVITVTPPSPTPAASEITDTKQEPVFKNSQILNKNFAKKSFSLGVKTNSDGRLSYSSSNKKVASINGAGKVTMKSMGRTVITVKCEETASFKAGTFKITLNLNPGKTVLSQAKSSKKNTLTVKWKKVKNISGYQIQYSTSKNFKGAKTAKASAKAVSGTVKKLKSSKKYYVRIRTYKKAYGQTVYSSWSKTKQVKIK